MTGHSSPLTLKVQGLPYSQGRALFTSIVEMGVFFKLHVLQIASVAKCKCCKVQVIIIIIIMIYLRTYKIQKYDNKITI